MHTAGQKEIPAVSSFGQRQHQHFKEIRQFPPEDG